MFQLGHDRYALEAQRVVEVVPFLELKSLPQAPRGVAGLFNYRGRPVPAIDLSELSLGRSATQSLSTRIIVVRHASHDGTQHLLGLIAENATEMLRQDPSAFIDPGVRVDTAPYLGRVLMDSKGVIQWIHEEKLLTPSVRELLFPNNPAIADVAH